MVTLLCIDMSDGQCSAYEDQAEQFSIRSAIETYDGDVDAFLDEDDEYGGTITVSKKEGNKYITVHLEYEEGGKAAVVGLASDWVDDDPRND